MRDARGALAVGFGLVALALVIVLSGSPRVLAGSNGVEPDGNVLTAVPGGGSACQGGETLPAGASAVRISLGATAGPRVAVVVRSPDGRVLARGVSGRGWLANVVTVPIAPVARTVRDVTVCFGFRGADERISFFGVRTPARAAARSAGRALPGRVAIEYVRAGDSSWWSLASSVARRMGLGRAWAGTWVAVFVGLLMAAVIAAGSWLLIGTRRVGAAAWICALVATGNAVAWSLITPPFQVPDEQAHFAYVEQLARGHSLPSSASQEYALDEVQALESLQVGRVSFEPQHGTIASRAQQRTLEAQMRSAKARTPGATTAGGSTGAAGTAASEPPLYYALEAVPYELGAGGSVLDQLALMRLLSATLAGLTALFAFLFLRELLPGSRYAWTVGGLGVAFMPGLAFISGAVNPEAGVCAVAAAIFYCLARGFRRGLTRGLALALGALIAAGFLTKLNFLGLAPAAVLGLLALAWRRLRTHGAGDALRVLAPGLALGAAPVVVYVVANALSHHQTLGLGSGALRQTAKRSLLGEASYIWQLYLPRLPGMRVYFADVSPPRDVWFNGLVGEYGFEDTFFPAWVARVAIIPVLAIAALAARELVRRRAVLRARLAEIAVYLGLALGVMALVGASSYLWFPAEAAGFPEARYLLPLIPLFGLALALAVRGAGRRWGAAVGALLVVLLVAHDIFSQLQEIARYYG